MGIRIHSPSMHTYNAIGLFQTEKRVPIMKILCLFSKDFSDFQKQQIMKKFMRQTVTLAEATLDSMGESDSYTSNAVLFYGLHDQDVETVEKIRHHFKKLPFLAVGHLSRKARIKALQSGADFYVDQKTPLSEVVQILHALKSLSMPEDATREIKIGNLRVSLLNHDAWHQEIRLKLTRKEYLILRHLALHNGQTLSKDDLLGAIWNEETQVNENSLEVLISRLRKKMSGSNASPMIHTVYGVGYCLE